MTPAERKRALTLIYRHTHKDYKGARDADGKRTILMYREPHGTCLVELDELTDAEIARDLPYAERMEQKRLERKASKP